MSLTKEYYLGLGDRCWKLLPIFEGIDTNGHQVFNEVDAIKNFEKNLNWLLIEIKGSVANYGSNNYCEQVINLLTGLQQEHNISHMTVRSVTLRCFDLCRKASEGNGL